MNIQLAYHWRYLWKYLRQQRWRVVILSVLLLASIGLQILNPLVLRYFIDTAIAGGTLQTLLVAVILFIGIAFVIQAVSVAETYYAEQIAWTATDILRADLARHVLGLDMGFHKIHLPGELIERVDGDVSTLANFFSRFVIYVVGNLLLLIGILAVIFSINLIIGLALSAFVMISMLTLHRMRGIAIPRFQALRQVKAEMFGFLEERLAGTDDIRANGATAYMMNQLYPLLRSNLYQSRTAAVASGAGWVMTVMLFVCGTILALGLSTYLLQIGVITIGTVYLIFYYTEQLRRPIELITRHLQDLQQASVGLTRVQELFSIESIVQDREGGRLPTGSLSVQIDGLSFEYDGGERVLHDISLSLAAGRVLGLIGHTGSEKTTLTRLLMRFYNPSHGAIRLGGIDISTISLSDLRRSVSMVTQEVQLFDATLRDNLTFFNRNIPDRRLIEVIQDLGLEEWFKALPDGLDARINPSRLSAGQSQLLAMARAFLKDPGLVILDEATARLDLATQRLLERGMVKLLERRTAIIIAHRLETVEKVDEIVVLEGGKIIEHGARSALMNDPGSHFHRMWRVAIGEVQG